MDEDSNDELHRRIRHKDWDGVKQLLETFERVCNKEPGVQVPLVVDNETAQLQLVQQQQQQQQRVKDLFKCRYREGQNPLHRAILKGAPKEILFELIEIGGKDVVLQKDRHGYNALHTLCSCSCSCVGTGIRTRGASDSHSHSHAVEEQVQVVTKLLEIGGRDIVLEQDRHGWNPLQHICNRNSKIGSRNRNNFNRNFNDSDNDDNGNLDLDLDLLQLSLLIDQGGADVLTQIDERGRTPLQFLITSEITQGENHDNESDQDNENAYHIHKVAMLIDRGEQLKIGGEYGIGGVFAVVYPTSKKQKQKRMQDKIYKKWSNIVLPALEQVMNMRRPHDHEHQHHHLPVLQAAIVHRAPPDIIKSTIQKFTEFVHVTDSFGKLPIDVAVQHRLSWTDGMNDIIMAFSSLSTSTSATQESYAMLKVCLKNGLQWDSGMSVIIGCVGIHDIERKDDEETGLYPFMLAASTGEGCGKNSNDLGSIFHLIRRSPRLVQIYDHRHYDKEQCLRKRRKRF